MSMIKFIDAGAQDFDVPAASLIKLSSRGLLGLDRTQFEKRASAQLTHEIEKLARQLADDEPLIHLIAIGATEDYGANRNADGFRRAVCQQYHPSFVKYAKFYRDHQNKKPERSYGQVKYSMWNDPMKRIELLVTLNGSPEAARRNGGLFADREMQKLAAGKEIPVSMACRVPFDVCSWCGNQSRTRDDYCTSIEKGGSCEAGGLKENLGALVEMTKNGSTSVHQLHADNTLPTFFDISHVFRPADRIAYVSGLLKAASAPCGGAALAEAMGITAPYEVLVDSRQPPRVQRLLKLAYQLADLETDMHRQALPDVHVPSAQVAFAAGVQAHDAALPQHARAKFAHVLRALVDQRAVLPLPVFLRLVTDVGQEKAAELASLIRPELPGVYTRMLGQSDLPTRLAECAYVPGPAAAPYVTAWAVKHAQAWSLDDAHVRRRATQATIRDEGVSVATRSLEKSAMDQSPMTKLAEEYALYKLAFLGALPEDSQMPLTASLTILQNYAS